ncbi:PilN domain-containing protein [Shewanella sp.]|uniref:PilN domain-containing protein n=1 Tax=Shewanella sp. TaxID=50422 RepID=UPI003563F6FA
MSRTHINLYDESLLPARLRLSFARLKLAVSLVLVLILSGMGLVYWQLQAALSELADARSMEQQLNTEKQQLEQRIASHKPDAALVAEVTELQDGLELKRLLLGEIAKQQRFTRDGYGALLTDLARSADGNVWLGRILVADGELRFEGYASNPRSIPLWVERLNATQTLKGKQFATMTMAREPDRPLGFVLTSGALREVNP